MIDSSPVLISESTNPYIQAEIKEVFDKRFPVFITAVCTIGMYGILVPLFLGMILVSSKERRKSFLYRFLCVIFFFETFVAILNTIMCVLLLGGKKPVLGNSILVSTIGSHFLTYLCCLALDLCLAFKLANFFPSSLYAQRFRMMVMMPIFLLSIARFTGACIVLAWYARQKLTWKLNVLIAYAVEQVSVLPLIR